MKSVYRVQWERKKRERENKRELTEHTQHRTQVDFGLFLSKEVTEAADSSCSLSPSA